MELEKKTKQLMVNKTNMGTIFEKSGLSPMIISFWINL